MTFDVVPDDGDEGRAPSSQLKARPDIRAGDRVWAEVETMRGLGRHGSSPFFALEAKLRRKAAAMAACSEAWLIVPCDVALLARTQLAAVVRNLTADPASRLKLRLGFIDLVSGRPVFVSDAPGPQSLPAKPVAGASWRGGRGEPPAPEGLKGVAGYASLKKRLERDQLDFFKRREKYESVGIRAPSGILLYGPPGCGKSLIGRALAADAGLVARTVMPSHLTSQWLGRGVEKIRELFDWALRQGNCFIIIDELDGIAPQRGDSNMHSDERRQVSELLTQLDRLQGSSVTLVATTNYIEGIDTAVRRAGRFDVKIPILPPTAEDRRLILTHYLRGKDEETPLPGSTELDLHSLAQQAPTFHARGPPCRRRGRKAPSCPAGEGRGQSEHRHDSSERVHQGASPDPDEGGSTAVAGIGTCRWGLRTQRTGVVLQGVR